MTEKRFSHRKWYNERQLFDGEKPFAIVDVFIQADEICDKLNEIAEENEQLKEEKEFWKSDACFLLNLNSILSNELSIAQEQGYESSKSYKKYIASIKTEYDKIKTHNNRLKELKE